MFYPARRFLWLIAIVFVPACAAPAFLPDGLVWIAALGLALAAIAAADLLVSRHALSELRVTSLAEVRGNIGEPIKVPVQVTRKPGQPWPAKSLRLGILFPAAVDVLRDDLAMAVIPDARAMQVEFQFRGGERGEFKAGPAYLGRTSTLGLWQLRCTEPLEIALSVQFSIPAIAREAARILATHTQGSERLVARSGRGREFEHLREYVPNDDVGDVDWKATARRRFPVVRQYRIERTQDIYVCIDASRLSGRSVISRQDERVSVLDEYVKSAILLQCAIRQAGDRFGLLTFSNRVHHFFKATSASTYERTFRLALHPLKTQFVAPAYEEAASLLRSQAKFRALIIFFTSVSEPQLAESFSTATKLLARQHLVVVACPADRQVRPLFTNETVDAFDDLYGELAGHLMWKKLAEMRAQLSAFGIRMNVVTPGRLGLTAAADYLDIKERQLL